MGATSSTGTFLKNSSIIILKCYLHAKGVSVGSGTTGTDAAWNSIGKIFPAPLL